MSEGTRNSRNPTLKGELDLDLSLFRGARSFIRELSLLPSAFCDITLRDRGDLSEVEIDELLMASRKTLNVVRVLNRKSPFRRVEYFHDFQPRSLFQAKDISLI